MRIRGTISGHTLRAAYVVGLLCASAWSDSMMWLGTTTIGQGGFATVNLFVASDEPLSGFNCKLQLPTGVIVSTVTRGPSVPVSFIPRFSNGANGEATVLAYSTADSFTSPSGIVALQLQLSAAANAPIGNFPLQIVESRERDINSFQVLTPRGLSDGFGEDPVPHIAIDGLLSIKSGSGQIFPDAALKAIVEPQVRQQLGLAPNAPVGIAQLQHPSFQNLIHTYNPAGGAQPIRDLSGLEYAVNLKILTLIGHSISDLRPLQPLTSLAEVQLDLNDVQSIEPLSALTQLSFLSVTGNRIASIAPLSSLTAMSTLKIDQNEVSSINAIGTMPQLLHFTASDNLIGNIDVVAGMPNLSHFEASDNLITDLLAFATGHVPSYLWLKYNLISSLGPLVTRMQSGNVIVPGDQFFFDGNPLSSCQHIGVLAGAGVSVSPTQAGCLDPQVRFSESALQTSVIAALNAEFGAGFAGSSVEQSELALLTTLNLTGTGVTSLEGLQGATGLRTLIAPNLVLADLSTIFGLTQLEVLRLNGSSFKDTALIGLESLVNLKDLRLDSSGISRIDFVKAMTKLEVLHVKFNQISDITPMRNLVRLKVFQATGNLISDISACVENGGLGAYDTLHLGSNPLGSQAICVDLPKLYARPFTQLLPASGTFACEGDAYEPDNSPLLARRIFLNESHISKSLVNTGQGVDQDWVKFSFTKTTPFVFEVATSRLDTRDVNFLIEIFRDEGIGKEPHPLMAGLNRQPASLPAGKYLARITEAAETPVGDYMVYLAGDLFEPTDNTQGTGSTLEFSQPHVGHTMPEGDVDWFKLSLANPVNFIQLRTTTVYGQTLPELFGPNDQTDLVPATFSSDDDTQFFNNLSAGQYWVRVRDFPEERIWNYHRASGPRITQSYSLRVDPQTVPDGFEDDDVAARASALEFGPEPDGAGAIKQSHNFHDFGDVDWYAFLATNPAVNPVFEVTDLGSRAYPVLDVFAADATTLLASGVGTVELDVSQVGLGKFFVRIRNANPGIFGNDTAYGAAATQGTQATAIMYGTVYNDANGLPVSNARVEVLASFEDPDLLFEPTDGSGAYAIQGVPVDLYDVQISATGFQTSTQQANVNSILLADSVFDWRILPSNAPLPTDLVYVAFDAPAGGRGTVEEPLNSIVSSAAQVQAGGSLVLLPGATGEVLTINKAMVLLAVGPTKVVLGSGPMPKTAQSASDAYQLTRAEEALSDSESSEAAHTDSVETIDDGDDTATGDGGDEGTSTGGGGDAQAGEIGSGEVRIVEPALPFLDTIGALRASDADSALAIRLRSESNIDPATIWGPVHGYESRDVTVSWQEASPGDMRDIWVIYEPNESWYVEDVLNIAVGARSTTGDAVSSSNFSFQVESAEQREVRLSNRAEPLNVPGADPESGESNAEVLEDEPGQFSIHPDTVYAQPRRVWIPVPEQVTADNARIYYYHPHGADRGWYPAEQVEDWLVPDSTVTVMFDNTRYLGFMVRHAGVIQLGIDE